MGYHLNKDIIKGELGEFSKIVEEYQELEDAHAQGSPVLQLVEISDLLGAIEAYTKNHYNISLYGLYHMTKLTRAAFEEGER